MKQEEEESDDLGTHNNMKGRFQIPSQNDTQKSSCDSHPSLEYGILQRKRSNNVIQLGELFIGQRNSSEVFCNDREIGGHCISWLVIGQFKQFGDIQDISQWGRRKMGEFPEMHRLDAGALGAGVLSCMGHDVIGKMALSLAYFSEKLEGHIMSFIDVLDGSGGVFFSDSDMIERKKRERR
eukprot:scaffold60658_cov61-Attheya_sp.AAC.1